eukprot:4035560-Alexandrium_andersonii.AAC.1
MRGRGSPMVLVKRQAWARKMQSYDEQAGHDHMPLHGGLLRMQRRCVHLARLLSKHRPCPGHWGQSSLAVWGALRAAPEWGSLGEDTPDIDPDVSAWPRCVVALKLLAGRVSEHARKVALGERAAKRK